MRLTKWWGLAAWSLVGCGTPVDAPVSEESSLATVEVQEPASACTPDAAHVVKELFPPDREAGPSWNTEPRPEMLTDVQGTLYFVVEEAGGDAALWKSDGTAPGTVALVRIPSPDRNDLPDRRVSTLTAAGTKLYFQVFDPATGWEPWVSDGTPEGTHLLADLAPGSESSDLWGLEALNGNLSFFRRSPGSSQPELWTSDGTVEGTYRVWASSETPQTKRIAVQQTRLFFHQDTAGDLQLWRTTGTPDGTARVRGFGAQTSLLRFWTVGKTLLFVLQDAVNGTRLWRTDGTVAGTWMVKPLGPSGNLSLGQQSVLGGTVVFVVNTPGTGPALWKTDGTEAGTVKLDDFNPEGNLLALTPAHALWLVRASDLLHLELWRTSLSGSGSALVSVLSNPDADQDDSAYPRIQRVASSGGKVYLSQSISGWGPASREVSLFVTDGTTAGTLQLSRELSLSDEYHSPLFDTGNGTLLFAHRSGNLFVTDGSLAGTSPVPLPRDSRRPVASDAFFRVGNRIYFRAIPGAPGYALWSVPSTVGCAAAPSPTR